MEEETPVQEAPKTFTQEQLDEIIQTRLGKQGEKAQEQMTAKETELIEAKAKLAELALEAQKVKAASMTEGEHIIALQKSNADTKAELAEFKAQIAQAEQAKIAQSYDSADKDLLLQGGANPKYASFLLEQVKSSRGIENGVAFYKDGEGAAIDKATAIGLVLSSNPELCISDRVAGNAVPKGEFSTVDRSQESTEQYIARRESERAQQEK